MLKIVNKATGEVAEVVNGVRLFVTMIDGQVAVAGVDVMTCAHVYHNWFSDFRVSL